MLFFIWIVAVRYDFIAKFNWKLALCAGVVFCVSTEIAQLFVAGRTFDWWDLFFDALGLLLGGLCGDILLQAMNEIFKKK